MIDLRPFPSIETAIQAYLLERHIPLEDGMIGGDFRYDPDTMPFYVQINRGPGGRTGQLSGTFVVELEVFGREYLETESVASAIEALVLGYPYVVEADGRKVIIDSVFQNAGVSDLPWGDDSVNRFSAGTYVMTMRRH